MLEPVPFVVFWVGIGVIAFMLGRLESKIEKLQNKINRGGF